MFKIFLLALISAPTFAGTLSVVSKEYNFAEAPEYQAILAQLKNYGEFADKSTPATTPTTKPMSRGEAVVAEAKARNKALIAAQHNDKSPTTTDMTDWDKIKAEDRKTRAGWQKESRDQLNQWKKEQDIFLGKIKVYQENTFDIPAPKEVIIEKETIVNLPEVHIVNGAFKVAIRDQSARPTCSAFAGVRALEIILAQNNIDTDLSEQYFYWASKPDCQKSPCEEKGSWVTSAYRYSQKNPQIDIPTEASCVYQTTSMSNNETQVPLQDKCNQNGTAKVEAFTDVRTLADVIEKLKANTPVIMAAKLSENFYKNSGLVTLADSTKSSGSKLDRHSLGHAFLAVGVMELPKKLQTTEGQYCIVVANSWGKGWGTGGYSCLTENWLEKFRQPAPFVAVTKVSVK